MWSKYTALICFLPVLLLLVTCKDKEQEEEDSSRATIYASAVINGNYITFTRYSYGITQKGNDMENSIILSRANNERITLVFRGTETGEYILSATDTTMARITYNDPGGKIFRADSGAIRITEYSVREGVFSVSGGFVFNSHYFLVTPDTSYKIEANAHSGGFNRITNTN